MLTPVKRFEKSKYLEPVNTIRCDRVCEKMLRSADEGAEVGIQMLENAEMRKYCKSSKTLQNKSISLLAKFGFENETSKI